MSEERDADWAGNQRLSLRADCQRCFGLCCVAPVFAASADFAIDKAAGQACSHLGSDFRCRIHSRLRQQGFRGCAVYDCFGAGQHVSQVSFGGADWRREPGVAQHMFQVFTIMRQLHELLWHLAEALRLQPARPLAHELRLAFDETWQLTQRSPEVLLRLDVAAHWRKVNGLLLRVSELARATVGRPTAEYAGADLVEAELRQADLSGANLRGACLIKADLSGADLRLADVTGADFRDADLSGADLTESLFLTQSQLDAANGDAATKLPPAHSRPAHWLPSAATRSRVIRTIFGRAPKA